MTTPESLATKLTELAFQVTEGVIVELGSFHGKGSIALAREAKVLVYSIDDFEEKHGWIGERYGPEDEEIFYSSLREAGVQDKVVQIKMSFEEAAEQWQWDIGLLYWDPGVPNRFKQDFADWNHFIIPGGLFIVKDTPHNNLGTFPVIKSAVLNGKWVREDYRQGVTFLRRVR